MDKETGPRWQVGLADDGGTFTVGGAALWVLKDDGRLVFNDTQGTVVVLFAPGKWVYVWRIPDGDNE